MTPQNPSFFRTSNIYFLLALVLFAGSLVYGVFQYQLFVAQGAATLDNEVRTESLAADSVKEKEEYNVLATQHAKREGDFAKKILAVLPPDENYIDLTKQLDAYFAANDQRGNPIFQSSLRYGKGGPIGDTPELSALPLSMNIEATRSNFFKFLDFVNSSGSLENKVRLMEINSIQLNFPEGGEVVQDQGQMINFTVDMSAYYQTPKVAR